MGTIRKTKKQIHQSLRGYSFVHFFFSVRSGTRCLPLSTSDSRWRRPASSPCQKDACMDKYTPCKR